VATSREHARAKAAARLLASSPLDSDADRKALGGRLTELGVEAQVDPDVKSVGKSMVAVEKAKALGPTLITQGLEALHEVPEFKQRVSTDYVTSSVSLPIFIATFYIRHRAPPPAGESASARPRPRWPPCSCSPSACCAAGCCARWRGSPPTPSGSPAASWRSHR
jgi:hypothetical protein